jgi:hypothetical protein
MTMLCNARYALIITNIAFLFYKTKFIRCQILYLFVMAYAFIYYI